MSRVSDRAGLCPNCDHAGFVGEPCPERGCVKRGYHIIPTAHAGAGRAPDALIGTRVADYVIIAVLGEGGFGKVYLALQLPILMVVAIKLIRTHFVDPGVLEVLLRKFRAEAEALGSLSHPNIVRLFQYGVHQGDPYMVMEHVADGLTLKEETRRRARRGERFTPHEAHRILRQVADALQAAHSRHIVHRDVKPDNVMIQSVPGHDHLVRILDFGLAKFIAEHTENSMAIGTPYYMAPEQLARREIGPWTDVYALGVMAFQLLTGRRPFEGADSRAVVAQKMDPAYDPAVRLHDLAYPEPLLSLFRRSLAVSPARRFRTADAFRAALDALFPTLEAEERTSPRPMDLHAIVDVNALGELDRDTVDPAVHATATVDAGAVEAEGHTHLDTSPLPGSAAQPSFGPSVRDLAPAADARIESYAMANAAEAPARRHAEAAAERTTPDKRHLAAVGVGAVAVVVLALWTFGRGGETAAPSAHTSPPTHATSPAPVEVEEGPHGMQWISLPAGTYGMGSSAGDPDEEPLHTEAVPSFRIQRTEVTVAQYRLCVERGACTPPRAWAAAGWERTCAWGRARTADHPVNCTTWEQADAYCRWVDEAGRLPTEAEWEYAARAGGRIQTWPWGDEEARCGRAVMKDTGGVTGCGSEQPLAVCSRPRGNTAQGLCDMAGNVAEWVADAYSATAYADGPPASARERVIRGGSFAQTAHELRVTDRATIAGSLAVGAVGFRCVR